MSNAVTLQNFFHPLFAGTGGIDSWLNNIDNDIVIQRLTDIESKPLTPAQLNQLLVLSHEAGLSEGFFEYYWNSNPKNHPWDISCAGRFRVGQWDSGGLRIVSAEHLRWGFSRFYIDSLLFFGNIRSAYRALRDSSYSQLVTFFEKKCFPIAHMVKRGPALPLNQIPKDSRYLISEMACKSYTLSKEATEIEEALMDVYRRCSSGTRRPTIGDLIRESGELGYSERQVEFTFSATEVETEMVESEEAIRRHFRSVAEKFTIARTSALNNTDRFLSMVEELDVYVATSMRSRQDFRLMADFCEDVFREPRLSELNLRYFDPTLSAASGHEDKGLIECLMVKSAKILIYVAGSRDSYGKDAEAAMALSLGKPVIFVCDEEHRQRFYRDVHPLSRLIQFSTGVAVGALVVSSRENVKELLWRIFNNRMRYDILQDRPGHLRLREELTHSIVRLQTGDALLRETLWNYYGDTSL